MSTERRRENILEDNKYFEQTKYLLNPTIHKCLYVLVKYLFFGKTYMKASQKKLENFIDKLNKIGLNFEKGYLYNKNCYIDFMKKIFNFLKTQNFALATEIFENIIIRVLSFAFVAKTDEFFGKYLYNNLKEIKYNKEQLSKWVDVRLLLPLFNDDNNILNSLEKSLDIDDELKNTEGANEETIRSRNSESKQSTFLQILFLILKSKNIINKSIKDQNLDTTSTNTISGEYTALYTQLSLFFYGTTLGLKTRDQHLTVSISILISTYIHYLNRKSPLINYSLDSPNLIKTPFIFDLSEAGINDMYLNTIINPLRIEPRITDIEMNKNRFKEYGMLELHRLLMFNKSIKKISLSSCTTKQKSLNTFKDNFLPFDNFNVEELDMSSNYLKSDADTNLSKLITYFKGLKILVLSHNVLRSGLGYFFVTLKNLYRKNQSKLEELYLVNCELDDISFYELGELLKSKYCRLKCLCLNENKIPSDMNFFKSLKKNRSLEEIYFYDCDINNERIDEIERIISNTNLQSLYLYQNKIHDFNQYIRIIYRTNLIKDQNEKKRNILNNYPCLFNLNMNNSKCYNQNSEKLDLMLEGFKSTNLSILDLSSVIVDPHIEDNNVNFKYYTEVIKILDYLKKKQEEYKNALSNILESKVDVEKTENKLKGINILSFDSNKDIQDIINDENPMYSTIIMQKVNNLIRSSPLFNKDSKDNIKMYITYKREMNIFKENDKIKELKKLILI